MENMNHNAHSVYLMYYHLVIRQYIEIQERKSIEHSIPFSDLSNRRTEDTPWKNIWLLSFSVQPDA